MNALCPAECGRQVVKAGRAFCCHCSHNLPAHVYQRLCETGDTTLIALAVQYLARMRVFGRQRGLLNEAALRELRVYEENLFGPRPEARSARNSKDCA